MTTDKRKPPLRSRAWFDNPDNPGMTALYIERYLNYGITRDELQSGMPIVGIAQTGSRPVRPATVIHVELAERVPRRHPSPPAACRFEFPAHPIQETGKRPTARAGPQPDAYLGHGRGAARLLPSTAWS